MATVYADDAGALLRLLKTDDEEARYGPPPGYSASLRFDAETNAAVIAGIDMDWGAHLLLNGVLYRAGEALAIAPDSALTSERNQIPVIRQGLASYLTDTGIDAYLAAANPNLAQSVAALKATMRAVRLIIRLLALVMDYYLKQIR